MVLEEKEKEKWQVLMSKDGRRWQQPVHSTPLFLSFLCPHFSSVTVNLQTWIWWWYLVTTAMLNSLLWYFLPGFMSAFMLTNLERPLLFSVLLCAKYLYKLFRQERKQRGLIMEGKDKRPKGKMVQMIPHNITYYFIIIFTFFHLFSALFGQVLHFLGFES